MSFEIEKGMGKFCNKFYEGQYDKVLAFELFIPEGLPDIKSILYFDLHQIIEKDYSIRNERIEIGAVLKTKLLYSDGEEHFNQEFINDFNDNVEVKNLPANSLIRTKFSVEHFEYRLENQRKLIVKILLKVSYSIYEDRELEFINDLRSDELQMLHESINMERVSLNIRKEEEQENYFNISSEKPSIKDIVFHKCNINDYQYAVEEDGVVLDINLKLLVIYINENEKEDYSFARFDIPFQHKVEFDERVNDVDLNMDIQVADSYVEAVEDEDGDLRNLSSKIRLAFNIFGIDKIEKSFMTDLYSLNNKVTLEVERIPNKKVLFKDDRKLSFNKVIEFDGETDLEIGNIILDSTQFSYDFERNGLGVDIGAKLGILLFDRFERKRFSFSIEQVHLNELVELEERLENKQVALNLVCEEFDYKITNYKSAELQFKFRMELTVLEEEPISVIRNFILSELEPKKNHARIHIYFAKEQDTFWKIAKRYNTTIENLKRYNEEITEIKAGQKILVLE